MIHGVGIDLIEIDRIRDWYNKRPSMAQKILTDDEIEIFNNISLKDRKVEFLAGRFAVKEAFTKAMGTGIGKDYGFHSVNCLPDSKGKPNIKCDGFITHVSIAHTQSYAEAIVLVEVDNNKQD